MLLQASDGSLYGTTASGGTSSNGSPANGVIFKLTMEGELSNLVTFEGDSGSPGFMLRAVDQSYYGTLGFGPSNSSGALFKLNPDGTRTNYNPVSFSGTNGIHPISLVEDHAGNLYGVTQFGGEGSGLGFGTVFRIDTNSVFTTVARFNGTNGDSPVSLILGADGIFYGLTQQGGDANQGTMFRVTPDGNLSALFSFQGTNGYIPQWLVQGSDGNLYGTTLVGGIGHGSLFKMTTEGVLLWAFLFNGPNGSQPNVIMQSVDGNLYGTTDRGGDGYGTVFRITPNGDFTSMVSFDGANGSSPFFLMTGADGNLYGTTWGGGANGLGTVFRLSIPMSPVFQKPIQTNGSLVMTWSAVAGQSYQLQFNSDSSSTNWINLGGPIVATNGMMSATDPIGTDGRRWYRVALLP